MLIKKDFFKLVQDVTSSGAQSCLTLCDLMNRSMPGLPVHHQLPEFTQTHVHRVGDAIQPSHPLSSCLLLPSVFPSIRGFSNEPARFSNMCYLLVHQGLPGGSGGKASAYSAGDPGSIPGSGSSSGEGNGNPLQYSCLENPMDRGAR